MKSQHPALVFVGAILLSAPIYTFFVVKEDVSAVENSRYYIKCLDQQKLKEVDCRINADARFPVIDPKTFTVESNR